MTRRDLTSVVRSIREARSYQHTKPNGTDNWPIDESDYKRYEYFFKDLKVSLPALLARKNHPVVVDLLSSPSAIRSLFMRDPKEGMAGVSVALGDNRKPTAKSIDAALGITHITGDLAKPATWRKISETLNGKPVDLIMERGYAGMAYLPQHPLYFLYGINKIWDMLSTNNGVFVGEYLQINISKSIVKEWINQMKTKNIDIQSRDNMFILTRHRSSPNKLPTPRIS